MNHFDLRNLTMSLSAMLMVVSATVVADAKPAQCFTTDDGEYGCDVRLVEFNGSFAISAAGRPTYSLIMDAPGFAFGFINRGSRDVALPGIYVQEDKDPACWRNRDNGSRICAW